PLPDADCSSVSSQRLALEVDGNQVDIADHNGSLEFQSTDPGGAASWLGSGPISRCDKPSIAGGVTFCGMNSRLVRTSNGSLSYLVLCRKSPSGSAGPTPTDFWSGSNSKFDVLGFIIYNSASGE